MQFTCLGRSRQNSEDINEGTGGSVWEWCNVRRNKGLRDTNVENVTIEVPPYVSMVMNVTIQGDGPGFDGKAPIHLGLRRIPADITW
jgi:hypothetical protein